MQYYSTKNRNQSLDKNNVSCFIEFDKNAKQKNQPKFQNLSHLITQYRSNYSKKFPNQHHEKSILPNYNNDSYYSINQDVLPKFRQVKKQKNVDVNMQQKNQNKLSRVLSSQVLNSFNQFKLSKNSSTSTLFNYGDHSNKTDNKKEKLIQKLQIHKNSLNSIQQKLNKFGIQLGSRKSTNQQKVQIPIEKGLIKNSNSQSESNLLNFSKQIRPLTSLREKQYIIQQVHTKIAPKQELIDSINSVNSGGSHHSKRFKMNIQNLIGENADNAQIKEAFKKPKSFGNQKKSPICKEKQLGSNETQLKNFSPKSAGSMNSGQNWFKKMDRTLKQTISTEHSSKESQLLSINEFSLGKQIGKGKFGQVFICRHKKTGFISAIKIIKKQTIRKQRSLEQLTRQIKIQSFLNHCNNVKIYAFFDDIQNIYLLLQYCIEGHLYSILKQKKRFSEQEAVFIIKDICEGMKELHEKNIIHRDIKPQNVVMCYKMAKLCDYGWSVNCQNEKRQTFCGTPLYVSPELLTGKTYDYKVDIWALGIMTYQLLTGRLPFQITTQKQLRKIVTNEIKYPNYLSENAVSFMKHLLQKDPNYRNDIQSILKHQFLTQGLTKKQIYGQRKD